MFEQLSQALAALFGALIGGLLSVVASWLAQRVQTKGQWITQEIQRRQQLYGQFIEMAARCYAEALAKNEAHTGRLAKLYGDIGQMRLHSSRLVIHEANKVAHKILEAYGDINRTGDEIRAYLAEDSTHLFSAFGEACRTELEQLEPQKVARARNEMSEPSKVR